MKRKKKQAITLMEIMIVIFLIGLIAGVVGYNIKGSLEEGKIFRTKAGIQQLQDIMSLEIAKGTCSMSEAIKNPAECVRLSGIAKDPTQLLKDGWGQPLSIQLKGDDLYIYSQNLDRIEAAKNAKLDKDEKETKKSGSKTQKES